MNDKNWLMNDNNMEADSMNVTVYTSPECAWCLKVKEYLDSRHVAYEEVDVAANRELAREMVRKTHQRGIPVVEVDGEYIFGFDQDGLDSHFGK